MILQQNIIYTMDFSIAMVNLDTHLDHEGIILKKTTICGDCFTTMTAVSNTCLKCPSCNKSYNCE